MPQSIPVVPLELQAPVRALARAASLFRGFFVQAAEGVPIEQILEERGDVLDLADRTLHLWGAHLGLEVNGLLDVQEEESSGGPPAVKSMPKVVFVPLADQQAKKQGTSRDSASSRSRKQRRGP